MGRGALAPSVLRKKTKALLLPTKFGGKGVAAIKGAAVSSSTEFLLKKDEITLLQTKFESWEVL